jgi:hypothetical protein
VSWLYGVLAVAVVAAAAAVLVLGAMRRTARRQQAGLPDLPRWDPSGHPLLQARAARYLGTTYAPSPVRRFSGRGLLGRGVVDLALDRRGLRVAGGRPGDWGVPTADLRGVEVTSHHAGKVVYAPRVLVVDWQFGSVVLRSGFVLDDEPAARAFAEGLAAVAAGGEVLR